MHMMNIKELGSEELDTLRRFRTPFYGTHCHWRSEHPRGGTSFRSRSKSVRDCAITRGNASSPIVRQALRRPGILL